MGLFNHLFKNKLPQGDEKMEEGRQTPPSDGAAETPEESKPDLTVFLHPKAYVPRGGAAPVHPGTRIGGQPSSRNSERKTPLPAPSAPGEIVLTLGDVLSRIPTQLLKAGAHDPKRVLRFKIGDLSSDIARGRAAVPLSRIATLCPDIFQKEVAAEEDMDVRLPLQKLVEQIGLMRSNPSAPRPEKAPRPVPSEAPPALLPTRVPLAIRTPAKAPQSKVEPRPPTPPPPEPKPRTASAPFTPPVISEALRENILKAQPGPLRRNPASKAGNIVPFPSIAAKAETGPLHADEEHAKPAAESVPEEKLVLPREAREESVPKLEVAAQLHLVTAPAEIAPQQSLLKTLEAEDAKTEGVSLAQPTALETPREDLAKSQLLSLLRMKLHSAGKPAAFTPESAPLPVSHAAEPAREFQIESENRVAEPGEVSEVTGAAAEILPVAPELKPLESRVADVFEEKGRGPATPAPLEKSVPKGDVTPAPQAEIDHKKSAPEEPQPSESAAGMAHAVDGALKDLAPPEIPHRVSDAPIPAEIPKSEHSKKPEISAAEVLAHMPGKAAAEALLGAVVSSVESISPPKSEVAHSEIAPKETPVKETEIKAIETGEAALAELAKPKSPAEPVVTAGVSAAPPVKLPPEETEAGRHRSVDAATPPAELPHVETIAGGHRSVDAAAPPAKLPPEETNAGGHRSVDAATPHVETASKEVESKKVDASALEVSEVAIKAAAAAALLKKIFSHTGSIPPPKVEIAAPNPAPEQTEVRSPQVAATLEETHGEFANEVAAPAPDLAPKKAESEHLPLAAAAVFEEARKELAMPKPPEESGSKIGTVAASLVEMSRAETQPPQPSQADLKKSEVIPPGVFADSAVGSAVPELSHASAPKPEAPPQVEISHAEIAPQEQESRRPEPSAAAAQEQALIESPNGNITQSELVLPLALEPIHSDIAPRESAQAAPEAGAPVANAPEPAALSASLPAPRTPLEEPISIAVIPGSAEVEPKDALEPAVFAEAQSAKPPRESGHPIMDAPPLASHKDESISALLVSLAALTESSPEISDDAPLEMDEESPAQDAGKIRLRLSAILKNCPKEILAGALPRMRRNLGIELPLAQIEPQLPSGAVAISSLRFIAALPPEYMQHFVVREDVKVSIPIEEILRNLPEPERERIAQTLNLPPHATVEQIRAKIAQPAAEPPRIDPIPSAAPAEEANPVITAAAAAPSEAAPPSLQPIESVLEPAVLEVGESAPQPEPITPEPEAPVAALAYPPAPEAIPEPSPALSLSLGESSSTETPAAIAPLEEPPAVADAAATEKTLESTASAESTESAPAAEEPPSKPFALHIPTFRVFAPPPLNVNPSIISAPATPVPLAWAGHVSTQPPIRYEPAPPVGEAPIPPERGQPKQDAPPSPPEAPRIPHLAPPNADAAGDHHPPSWGAASLSPTDPSAPDTTPPLAPAPDSPPKLDVLTSPAPPVAPSLPPIESAAEQGVPPATPEPQKPDPQVAPPEPTALVRPPMVRPMVILPPPILSFTPAIEPPAAPPVPEKPFPRQPPPILPAFVPSAGPSAEIRREPAPPEPNAPVSKAPLVPRAPDQPKPESTPKATSPTPSKSRSAVPKIAGEPVAEKTPGPKPPKIGLSVPKIPVPRVPPVEPAGGGPAKGDPAIPPTETAPAPPPLPLARFDQDVLQNLFMTDELLDLPGVCQRISTLPGIQACVISRNGENVRAGEFPEGFEFSELLAFAPGVTQIAGRLPIGTLKHFTLFAETHSVSFFQRHGVQLCVVHRTRSFIPGVREKLVTVADELSKL